MAVILSLFAVRLIQLQGVDENDYAALAAEKGAGTVVLEAPRAGIYDRNMVALAESVEASKIVADPTVTHEDAVAIASVLRDRLGPDAIDYIDTVELLQKTSTRYVVLARHIPPEKASRVVTFLHKSSFPGVYVDDDTTRAYPSGDVAANIVGFLTDDDFGAAGIESTYQDLLAGQDGSATFQMADGQQLPLADSAVQEPETGTGIQLTLDQDLQFLAQRRLAQAVEESGGLSGSAIVMDVKTGQILALADVPTFDPNHRKLSPRENYGSRSIREVYEPGSVAKVLTFAALLDGGYVTPRTKVTVPPTLTRSEETINDSFSHGTLRLTAAGVLAMSSNIGTVRAAEQMPKREMYQYLRDFGLGSRTRVGLGGDTKGLITQPDTWLPITRATMAFGQGMSVNVIQLAAGIAAVANGGVYVQPSLVSGFVDADGQAQAAPVPDRRRVVSSKTADQVAHMMEGVTSADGTAPDAGVEGYRVSGKTGTAQRVDDTCNCYDGSYTVSFAGFAPADEPRFVVYVVVQRPSNGGSGGTTAGPVFRDLMAATLQKFGVPPTQTREPLLPFTW